MNFFQSRIANFVMSLANKADIDALLLKYRLEEDDDHFTVGEMTVLGSIQCMDCEEITEYSQTTVLQHCESCGGEWFVKLESRQLKRG